jgi:hypothetical protein
MDVHRTIDTEKGIVYTTVSGALTLNEIRADMEHLNTEAGYHPGMPVLVDLRGVVKLLTKEETAQLADFIKSNPRTVKRGQRALLVGSELAFGMYRMLESLASGSAVEYRVFRSEQEARIWIEDAAILARRKP